MGSRVSCLQRKRAVYNWLQSPRHHSCETIRVSDAVWPCQESSELLVEADDDESSLEHSPLLQRTTDRL
jgi:hypothetical protein